MKKHIEVGCLYRFVTSTPGRWAEPSQPWTSPLSIAEHVTRNQSEERVIEVLHIESGEIRTFKTMPATVEEVTDG